MSARSHNIANIQTPGYRPVEPVVTATEQGPRATIRERPLVPEMALVQDAGFLSPVNLAEELVQMRMAKHAYKASAKIVKTADDMTRQAINLIG